MSQKKGNGKLTDKPKKTRISVNKDDLDVASLKQFDHVASGLGIPRGKLLSRALYLAARELSFPENHDHSIKSRQKFAESKGKTVDEDILLDTESWVRLFE